jgi:hypothetical protein
MSADPNDPVRVTAGSLTQVRHWHEVLRGAGIESRVVGDDLTAGLGSAPPDSIELWVHRADVAAAHGAITGSGGHHRPEPEFAPGLPRGRPDIKPDRSRGPRDGAPPVAD